jgi:dienelactone hydrolase
MVSYGGAVHAFTDPAYTPGMVPGAEYNAKADQRSWEDMKLFFKQIFG